MHGLSGEGGNLAVGGLRNSDVGYLEEQWVDVGMVLASCSPEAENEMAQGLGYDPEISLVTRRVWSSDSTENRGHRIIASHWIGQKY